MNSVLEVITKIKSDQSQLIGLAPREFEYLIAELFASFGWEINITPQSKDGGYDILGISKDISGLQTSWIIECKKYSSEHKVGIELLRSLLGVKTHLGIPNAIIVTTSDFTTGARTLVESRNDLNLIDSKRILEWINKYQLNSHEKSYTSKNSFFSCFISYSSKDESFAQKLAARLKENDIRVWYAPEDIKPGQKIYNQVKAAISSFDKLLVIISENSMNSSWVKTELINALDKQTHEKRQVLFPISLVPYSKIKSWELFDSESGIDVAKELKSYFIPDFTNWENEKHFNLSIKKIIDALKKDEEIEPSQSINNKLISDLIQQFRGASLGDKAKLARRIGDMKEDAVSAIPALKRSLKSSSGSVRDAAAWALGEIGTTEALKILDAYERS